MSDDSFEVIAETITEAVELSEQILAFLNGKSNAIAMSALMLAVCKALGSQNDPDGAFELAVSQLRAFQHAPPETLQ